MALAALDIKMAYEKPKISYKTIRANTELSEFFETKEDNSDSEDSSS